MTTATEVYLIEADGSRYSVRLTADDVRYYYPTLAAALEAAKAVAASRFDITGCRTQVCYRHDALGWVYD
jgi:hypothetical protein